MQFLKGAIFRRAKHVANLQNISTDYVSRVKGVPVYCYEEAYLPKYIELIGQNSQQMFWICLLQNGKILKTVQCTECRIYTVATLYSSKLLPTIMFKAFLNPYCLTRNIAFDIINQFFLLAAPLLALEQQSCGAGGGASS